MLRIGILKAAEYPHVIMAAKKFGAKIVVFEDALRLTRAIASGNVDIGFSPLVTQVLFGLLLKSLKIHAVIAYNGSGVVSRKRIEEAKTFATSELSAMESNLKLFLDKAGMKEWKIRYFSSVERMISAFQRGEFDAIAVWEPYFSLLNGYRYEFREFIGDFPCCSMASNMAFYNSRREELVRFRKEIEKSLEKMDFDTAVKALSFFEFGIDQDVMKSAIRHYRFSAKIDRKDIEFLANYGLKLTDENVEALIDPL
jgi:predicted transcriptional regulator